MAGRWERPARDARRCCSCRKGRSAPDEQVDHGDRKGDLADTERNAEIHRAGELGDEDDDGKDSGEEGELNAEAPVGGGPASGSRGGPATGGGAPPRGPPPAALTSPARPPRLCRPFGAAFLRVPAALASLAHARAFSVSTSVDTSALGSSVARRRSASRLPPSARSAPSPCSAVNSLSAAARRARRRRAATSVRSRWASRASASSVIPLGGDTDDTAITGTSLDPSAARACSRSPWARRA